MIFFRLKYFWLFTLYALGGLAIGDFHPFARFNMYDNFPNWSYYFKIQDESGNDIPLDKITNSLNISRGGLGHMFSTICDQNNFTYGDGLETNEHRAIIGQLMMAQAKPFFNKESTTAYDSLKLYQVYSYLEEGQIKEKVFLLYQDSTDEFFR